MSTRDCSGDEETHISGEPGEVSLTRDATDEVARSPGTTRKKHMVQMVQVKKALGQRHGLWA